MRKIESIPGEDLGVSLADGGRFVISKNMDGFEDEVVVFDENGNAQFAGTVDADVIRARRIESEEFVQLGQQVSDLSSTVDGLVSSDSPDLDTNSVDSMLAQGGLVAGNTEFAGGTSFLSKAKFAAQTVFEKLVTFIGEVVFKGNVQFIGRPTFNKDTAGFAKIKQGARTVRVGFDQAYLQVPTINVTVALDEFDSFEAQEAVREAVLSGDLRYLVTKRSASGFTIELNKPAIEDITFSWVALAVGDANVFESDASSIDNQVFDTVFGPEKQPDPVTPTPHEPTNVENYEYVSPPEEYLDQYQVPATEMEMPTPQPTQVTTPSSEPTVSPTPTVVPTSTPTPTTTTVPTPTQTPS